MTHSSEKKILVVDHEPDVRSFLAACMEDGGFKVETAVDGVDALEKVKADPPDLITLDMVMPRKSGIRVMRELKQNEKWAKIPVIVITAHERDDFGSRYMEEFSAFAVQPRPKYIFEKLLTPDRLVKSICDILGVKTPKTDDPAGHQCFPDPGRAEINNRIQNEKKQETLLRLNYKTVIDLLPCYLTILDKEFKIIYANQRFINDFGDRAGSVCHVVYKGSLNMCRLCPATKSFRDKKIHVSEEIIETLEGKVYPVIIYTAPVFFESAQVDAVMELVVNISEIKRAQKELSSLGLAMAFMSHGIKNILEGLQGGSYLVDEGIHDNDMDLVKRGWYMVNNNITDISIMVQNLLHASKKRTLRIEKIPPCDIIDDSVNLFMKKAASLNVELKREISPNLPLIPGDRFSLRRMLNNLVSNALEACAKDRKEDPHHHIILRAKIFNELQFCFEVEDNGTGIDDATKKKIFREFFSTKGTEGTGLGLAVVSKVIKEHEGKIEVESVLGKGTLFRIILMM
jgi:nitrogen-specific signal transduction histidine kinase/CheY-like chemotaxis protein